MYDSLYGLATRSTPPRLSQRTVKTGTSIYQPRPTSASRYNRPAAFYDSTNRQLPTSNIKLYLHDSTLRQLPSSNIQLCTSTTRPYQLSTSPHLAEDPNTTTTDFTHTVIIPKINCHFCYICYLAFVSFIVFGCHLLARLNFKHLWGRHAYRPVQQDFQ